MRNQRRPLTICQGVPVWPLRETDAFRSVSLAFSQRHSYPCLPTRRFSPRLHLNEPRNVTACPFPLFMRPPSSVGLHASQCACLGRAVVCCSAGIGGRRLPRTANPLEGAVKTHSARFDSETGLLANFGGGLFRGIV